jgi:hypothetical protein
LTLRDSRSWSTSEKIAAWHACYNRFAANLNDALPPGKRIPAETLDMMTPAEFGKRETAWQKATEDYVNNGQGREVLKEELLIVQRAQSNYATQKYAISANAAASQR